jgi:GNAT superfamily N-acetyltransferase
MTFRAIEARDLAELFDLRASTRENPYSRDALRGIGITEETTAARLLTTNRGWLCETEGKLVGFAIGDGSTGEMCVIAVLPEFEGRRIGSRLLDAVEAWLYSLGWKELWLWTSADPKRRAFTFYTRHGWMISENKGEIVYMKKRMPDQPSDPVPAPVMPPAGQGVRPGPGAGH